MPSLDPRDYVSTDDRIIQAALVVAAAGTVARVLLSFQTALAVGVLAGVLNAPRTDDWEFGSKFGAVPAAIGGFAMTVVLVAGIPLDFYTFPFDTLWGETFRILGPFFEMAFFPPLYAIEGAVAFSVIRKLTGPAASATD